jgi:hypothetical protein
VFEDHTSESPTPATAAEHKTPSALLKHAKHGKEKTHRNNLDPSPTLFHPALSPFALVIRCLLSLRSQHRILGELKRVGHVVGELGEVVPTGRGVGGVVEARGGAGTGGGGGEEVMELVGGVVVWSV